MGLQRASIPAGSTSFYKTKMVDLTKSFINHIVKICLLAGKLILEEYEKPRPKILVKEDSSPVTEADLKANEIIVERLLKLDKTIPCLSEESNENNNVFDEEVFGPLIR